jgi:hypothetical protein
MQVLSEFYEIGKLIRRRCLIIAQGFLEASCKK